ncbi:MAG: hypothetical protein ACKPB7_02685, partial [Sphaerospermopsis kisseleviana]
GINLNPTVSNQSTSELQSRLEILEKALADLQESHFALSKKVDLMQSTGEPPSTKPVEVPVYKDAESEPDIGLHNELPKEDVVEQPIDTSIIDKPESSLDSELHKNNNARPSLCKYRLFDNLLKYTNNDKIIFTDVDEQYFFNNCESNKNIKLIGFFQNIV